MKEFIDYGRLGKPASYTDELVKQPMDLGVSWDLSEALSVAVPGAGVYYLYGTYVPVNEIWVVENVSLYKNGGYGMMSVGYGCEIMSIYTGFVGWYTQVCEFTLQQGQNLSAITSSTGAGTFYLRYRARVIYIGP